MAPLGLAILLFCLFTLFGKAFLELVRFRSPVLRNWLIAPTVGFALIEILVCFFNQVGNLPVKAFAFWLLLGMSLGSAVVLWWRKPVFPSRQLAPYGAVLAFSLLYTGWPALVRGFNWLSFVNGDMAYFAAGAVRMLEHPFYAMPSLQDLLGRNYTQYTWASHVVFQVRYGGEVLLAWSSGALWLNPLQVYMSLVLALQLTQLCAAGALVLVCPRLRRPALLAIIVLSLSPLFSLGSLYQLLPQSGGIPAMLVVTLLLAIEPHGLRQAWPHCLVLSTVLSGLFLHYPEVIAFGVLSAIVFWLVRSTRERRIPRLLLGCLAASPVLVCVMIRENVLAGIVNTLGNVQSAGLTGATAGKSIFPQFMIPSGLPNLFGLLPIGNYPEEPILSATVLIGLVLLTVVSVQAGIHIWRGYLYACMLGLMFAVGIVFFLGANDYGLFKLAMFCQPGLAACVAFLLMRALKRWWRAAPVLVLACTGFAHTYYTLVSAGLKGGSVLEVPQASTFGLNFTVPKVTAVSDIDLMPAQGLAAIVFKGSQVLYPSVARGKFRARPEVAQSTAAVPNSGVGAAHGSLKEVAGDTKRESDSTQLAALGLENSMARQAPERPPRQSASHSEHVPLRERIRVLLDSIREAARFPARKYTTPAAKLEKDRAEQMNRLDNLWESDFFVCSPHLLAAAGGPTHLLTLRSAFLLNVTSPPRNFADYGVFRLVPYGEVHDWLLFIPSSRGPDYYYERFGASFYQPESDPYRPGNFMSAVGRFFLLEVVNPADRLRLRISLTRSIMGASRVVLPAEATAYGQSSTRLPFVGAGSAAVYSEVISPVWRDGQAFVAIDFNQPPITFPNQKSGLMRLYNRDWVIDHRKLIGFCRDISAIPDREYARLTRPRKIENFPHDLLSDSGLEYSGIYEDGWISDEAFVKLGAASKGETVTVEGMVPSVGTLANGFLTVRVQVNDRPPQNQALKPGNFRLAVRVEESTPVTTVRVRFSDRTPLPGGDGRLVSALVRSISLQ